MSSPSRMPTGSTYGKANNPLIHFRIVAAIYHLFQTSPWLAWSWVYWPWRRGSSPASSSSHNLPSGRWVAPLSSLPLPKFCTRSRWWNSSIPPRPKISSLWSRCVDLKFASFFLKCQAHYRCIVLQMEVFVTVCWSLTISFLLSCQLNCRITLLKKNRWTGQHDL